MRSGMWFLAACGFVGLMLSVGSAEENPFEKDDSSFGAPPLQDDFDRYSRNETPPLPPGGSGIRSGFGYREDARPTTATESNSNRYKRPSGIVGTEIQKSGTDAADVPQVRNYHQQLFGDARPNLKPRIRRQERLSPFRESPVQQAAHSQPRLDAPPIPQTPDSSPRRPG